MLSRRKVHLPKLPKGFGKNAPDPTTGLHETLDIVFESTAEQNIPEIMTISLEFIVTNTFIREKTPCIVTSSGKPILKPTSMSPPPIPSLTPPETTEALIETPVGSPGLKLPPPPSLSLPKKAVNSILIPSQVPQKQPLPIFGRRLWMLQ